MQHHDELAAKNTLASILDDLTDDDVCMLMESEEEVGGTERGDQIFARLRRLAHDYAAPPRPRIIAREICSESCLRLSLPTI